MSWRDQQVTMTTVPGDLLSRVTGNAARSRSWGGEVELSYAATDRLDLYGSIGLLKTRFVDFNDDQWGNFSGLPFPGAPERSIALGFRWGDDLGWFGAASAKHVSSSLSRLEPGAGTPPTLKPRTTVDAEIGYGWDRAKVTAYATNLFDKEYFVYEAGPGSLAALGKRREVGLRLDYRF